VLIDPHNAYAPVLGDRAEVFTQRNMQQPLWLLTFEELIGNAEARKSEVEILQELIPLAKARNGAGRSNGREGLRRSTDIRFTVDTRIPYRISNLTGGTQSTRRRHRRQRPARRHAAPRAAGTGTGRGLAFRGAATPPDKLQR
jgi:hypothetical protein